MSKIQIGSVIYYLNHNYWNHDGTICPVMITDMWVNPEDGETYIDAIVKTDSEMASFEVKDRRITNMPNWFWTYEDAEWKKALLQRQSWAFGFSGDKEQIEKSMEGIPDELKGFVIRGE